MAIDRTYYSLAETAEILGCKSSDVLHLGSCGKLELMVSTPQKVDVRAYDSLIPEDNHPVRPSLLPAPEFLVLWQSQCRKLETQGEAHLCESPLGYSCRQDGALQAIKASYGYADFRRDAALWCLYGEDNQLTHYRITPDNAFVPTHSLKAYQTLKQDSEQHCRKTQETAPESAIQQVAQDKEFQQSVVEKPLSSSKTTKPRKTQTVTATVESEPPVSEQALAALPRQQPFSHLKIGEVMERTRLSKTGIYNRLNVKSEHYDPTFPIQVQLGEKSVAWLDTEIDAWLASLKKRAKSP